MPFENHLGELSGFGFSPYQCPFHQSSATTAIINSLRTYTRMFACWIHRELSGISSIPAYNTQTTLDHIAKGFIGKAARFQKQFSKKNYAHNMDSCTAWLSPKILYSYSSAQFRDFRQLLNEENFASLQTLITGWKIKSDQEYYSYTADQC